MQGGSSLNKNLWNKFLNGELAVNCRTENQAKKFLKYCEEQGIKWTDGTLLSDYLGWEEYKEKTTYGIQRGLIYRNYDVEVRFGIEVIPYKQFFKPEPEKKGLYGKYNITKADGTECDPDADYFVLRLDKDKHAREAVLAYADSVEVENPILARDIRDKVKHYEEPEYMTFDEAARTGKNFKHKDDKEFKDLHDNLINAAYPEINKKMAPSQLTELILKRFDAKAWEAEK